jgi:alkanesulfonate monooxygenase SsuD/methylene tetrahydromethanopterin reductase-like flavin-dependent oxidoreductase (luciferase family)
VDYGLHLPLMQFGEEPLSARRLQGAVEAARDGGFAGISANDHFLFSTPWLDGPTALASVIASSGTMTLATTISLAVLRGPVPLAKTLAALDLLSEGRMIAALGPGSSKRDYEAIGVPFEQRWQRFDEVVPALRALLNGGERPDGARYYPIPAEAELAPSPAGGREVPLWIGSWGSKAGLRRVARLADGWLASAYNTTPAGFARAAESLSGRLSAAGRDASGFPNALSTMWTWVSATPEEGRRVLEELLAPLLGRDPNALSEQVCVGTAEHCAELLSSYAQAGCERVYLWPLGEERRQVELLVRDVIPRVGS